LTTHSLVDQLTALRPGVKALAVGAIRRIFKT
jgi:hypothetical protein